MGPTQPIFRQDLTFYYRILIEQKLGRLLCVYSSSKIDYVGPKESEILSTKILEFPSWKLSMRLISKKLYTYKHIFILKLHSQLKLEQCGPHRSINTFLQNFKNLKIILNCIQPLQKTGYDITYTYKNLIFCQNLSYMDPIGAQRLSFKI